MVGRLLFIQSSRLWEKSRTLGAVSHVRPSDTAQLAEPVGALLLHVDFGIEEFELEIATANTYAAPPSPL